MEHHQPEKHGIGREQILMERQPLLDRERLLRQIPQAPITSEPEIRPDVGANHPLALR